MTGAMNDSLVKNVRYVVKKFSDCGLTPWMALCYLNGEEQFLGSYSTERKAKNRCERHAKFYRERDQELGTTVILA